MQNVFFIQFRVDIPVYTRMYVIVDLIKRNGNVRWFLT